MNLKKFVTISRGREVKYTLVPIGDIHYGTRNCDIDKLKEIVEWVKNNQDVYWLGIGDFCEFICISDRRFDPANIALDNVGKLCDLALYQLDGICKILKPIAHKCIGLLEGNHEECIRLKYHISIVDVMAHKLRTENLGSVCMIRWVMQRKTINKRLPANMIDIFAAHNRGNLNKLKQTGKDFDADIYLSGHTHLKVGEDTERLVLAGHKELRLVAKKRIFAVTGSFYKTYQVGSKSYAEKAGYAPSPTGVVKITIEPFRRKCYEGTVIDLPPHIHISE